MSTYQKLPQNKIINALIDAVYYIQNSDNTIANLLQNNKAETPFNYACRYEKNILKKKQLKEKGVYYNVEMDEFSVKLENSNLTLTVTNYSKIKEGFSVNINAIKLLDWILIEAKKTPKKSRRIILFLNEYQFIRGLSDRSNFLEKMKNSIQLLNNIQIEYEYYQIKEKKKKELMIKEMKLIDGEITLHRGILTIPFSEEFYEVIPKKLFAYIPDDYFSINDKKYRYAAFFIRKLAVSKKINWKKERENIIGIYSIYGKIFKSIQKIKQTFDRGLLTPFENNMNAIPNISWSYRGERPLNYSDFDKAFIEVEWKDYPTLEKNLGIKKTASGDV
ncbi:hypothetical protein AZF37_09670 (plasmid) [endosymbiont 'TC1' of Trimyema compressum]|uniref:hypothetical protein n=1 Tax=endosymbiont 'TC1' of Trimyema compressum TaxID=243899 RepID=UPI0007F10B32|nr:hypothetical protein [endosymbiont 'TC1' of Trimyema compressum]AMP21442.1 hypothetical protein AZF37_09670 [endosymbiont 'TC1' of Trimyema compressum]